MVIDLTEETLFECDSLDLNKKITFVLGKNGTGKTTLTDVLAKQTANYDVSVFKGFDNIIDDNKRLNAVVLGEENTIINRKIEEIWGKIAKKESEKKVILKSLNKPDDESESNYWTRREEAKKEYENAQKDIDSFIIQAASLVRKKMSIMSVYNKNNFKNDIERAKFLDSDEKKKCEETLQSETKIAPDISFPKCDSETILKAANELLRKKVIEKTRVARIDSQDKRNFAENGLRIHKKGEICAFCGSYISDEVFTELENYFSVDEVKIFQQEISGMINAVSKMMESFTTFNIDVGCFYPQFQTRIREIREKCAEKVREYSDFLQLVIDQLSNKKAELFVESDMIKINIPSGFENMQADYDALVVANNKNDLQERQTEANEKLRLHYVCDQLDKFNYKAKMAQLVVLENEYKKREREYDDENEKIVGNMGLDAIINGFQNEIIDLQKETKSEKILALRIKNKLNHMVSFELEPCKDEKSHGIYKVKDICTGEIRDITKLSTGEKNIIAFLYFMQKLNEIKDEASNKPKLIVFDDPMSSNDDNMQYLIIEELVELMKSLEDTDRFVLLTHNKHFYMNVTYKKTGKRIHLLKNGKNTVMKEIENETKDIKTSYEALWFELKFIYDSDASADMMLNPIRRIIETFTKFNGLKQAEFCSSVAGAKKLFDVNSHSIDDLEADLNGKTKDDIKQLFYDCFKNNEFEEHFMKYWPECGIADM